MAQKMQSRLDNVQYFVLKLLNNFNFTTPDLFMGKYWNDLSMGKYWNELDFQCILNP